MVCLIVFCWFPGGLPVLVVVVVVVVVVQVAMPAVGGNMAQMPETNTRATSCDLSPPKQFWPVCVPAMRGLGMLWPVSSLELCKAIQRPYTRNTFCQPSKPYGIRGFNT